MKIIAMLDMSTGNETVGEMWTETKIFQETDTLKEIYKWAKIRHGNYPDISRINIKLSVAQEESL